MKKAESTSKADTEAGKAPSKSPVVEFTEVAPTPPDTAKPKGAAAKPADSTILGKQDGDTKPATKKTESSSEGPVKLTRAVNTAKENSAAKGTSAVAAAAPAGGITKAPAATADKIADKPADKADKPAPPAMSQSSPGSDPVSDQAPHKLENPLPRSQPSQPAASTSASQSSPASQPAPTPKTPSPQAKTVRKGSFWPLVLGGAVAAGIGSVVTIWALPHLPASWLPPGNGAGVDAQAIRADAVAAGGQAGADAAQQAIAAIPKAESGGAAMQAALDAQAQQIADLQARLQAAPSSPDAPGADLLARLDAQAQQIADLQSRQTVSPEQAQKLQTLVDQADALQSQIRTAAEQAQAQIAAAQADAAKLQEAAQQSTQRAEAVAAIAALRTALDQGVSTQPAVEQLKQAGVQPPEAVTGDVPSLATLQDGFDPAARAALRAALKQTAQGEDAIGLIGNFLRAQTGARSVTPREGTDPDAILSRAGAAVQVGDIGKALDEIGTLPEVARVAPAMAAWITQAQAHQAAQSAVSQLSGQTN